MAFSNFAADYISSWSLKILKIIKKKYLTIPTYSFPAYCYAFTNLVALFKQTIKQPVTFGSRVPECPVLSTFNILLIQLTTSCDEGFEGLSKFITPYLRCSTNYLFNGV